MRLDGVQSSSNCSEDEKIRRFLPHMENVAGVLQRRLVTLLICRPGCFLVKWITTIFKLTEEIFGRRKELLLVGYNSISILRPMNQDEPVVALKESFALSTVSMK